MNEFRRSSFLPKKIYKCVSALVSFDGVWTESDGVGKSIGRSFSELRSLKLSGNVLRKRGGGNSGFPPRFSFRAQINSSSPLELKIELCTYRSNSDMIKFLKQKSDMFWYPPGPIFQSNFQNGARNKHKKIKKVNIDAIRILNELELRQHFNMQ